MQTEYAALVAVDWADRKHAWTMEAAGASRRESGSLDHTPEAVESWAAELQQRFAGKPIAVALEQSRGSLVFMLTKYEHLVIFPVHPTTLANYRKSFRPSGAKDDPGDAGLLLDILSLHRDKLRRLHPDTPETRTLQFLVEERRKLVREKTRCSNRITSHLKMYFPLILDWFDEIGSYIAVDFLLRWPSLEQLRRARPATIERFFLDHNSRNAERITDRLQQLKQAIPATKDAAVVTASVAAIQAWSAILKPVLEAIATYEEQIDALARQHPDYALIKSFPGAGPVLAPRLIAALGTQRDRYATAHELECYSGIAPVVASSGQQHWVHWRISCPKFLRQTFHEWALHSIAQCVWAREFYDRQRAKGNRRNTAIRALAFKWIRILFRCWKERTPYEETRYLAARAQRHKLARPADFQWKTEGGFKKLGAPGA